MAHALRSGLRNGGLRRGGLHAGLEGGSIFNIASLDLNFARYKNTGSLVTFTRASSGTYVGSDGVLRTAVTNLLLRSEEFDNASWTKLNSTVTVNAAIAPNGTTTADKLIANNGTTLNVNDSAGSVFQTIAGTSAIPYAYSFYAKAAEVTAVRVRESVSTGARVVVDLLTGEVTYESGTSASFTVTTSNVGDGWWRIVLFRTPATTLNFVIKPGNTTGDGTSGLFLWGAQLEQSATVGEYIPTTSAINSAPRFDHNPTTGESLGLLVEEARTNLVLQSNAFTTTWSNTDAVATATQTTAPDGTTAGWKLAAGTGNTNHNIFQNIAFTAVATTASVFVKYLDHRWVGIRMGSAASQFFGSWDLQNGVVGSATAGATIGMQAFGNGWYRLTLTATLTSAGNANCIIALNNADAIALTTYTGTGTGIYIFGAQLEAGAFPTSYISTTTAAATRSADVASITGTNFSSWYNQTEGTVFCDNSQASIENFLRFSYQFDDATANNTIYSDIFSAGRRGVVIVGGVAQASITTGTISANTYAKQALGYAANNFGLSLNGGTSAVDTTGTVPSGLTRMSIGNTTAANSAINGTIRRLTFWPTRLANSTLQSITQ